MSQRLQTLFYIWCLLTSVLLGLGYHLTSRHTARSYPHHVPESEDRRTEVTEYQLDTKKILYGENHQCRERTQIIFAKTHKTGSTTLQNILFRFGQEHNLMFLLPKSGTHYFNLRTLFRRSMADLYRMYRNVRSVSSLHNSHQ